MHADVHFDPVDMPITSNPCVCSIEPGRFDILARSPDGRLAYRRLQDATWYRWEQLGTPQEVISSDPCAVSSGGQMDVFARGTDNALHHIVYNSAVPDRPWTHWEQLEPNAIEGGPSACSWGPGRIDVFVRGTDDKLYHKWCDQPDPDFGTYHDLGGALTSDPAAASWGPGRLDVFVRNIYGTTSHNYFENGGWQGWEALDGQIASKPSVCSAGTGILDLFALAEDGGLIQKSFVLGVGWLPWVYVGAKLARPVACLASAAATGRLDLFSRNPAGHLTHSFRPTSAATFGPTHPQGQVAIALAGGGSKGDFEVGALHFLYQSEKIRPDILATTSVGSVNGLKLAEGDGGPAQGLSGLIGLWLGINSYRDFFVEKDWLLDAHPVVKFVRQAALDFASANSPGTEDAFSDSEALRLLRGAELSAVAERLDKLNPKSGVDFLVAANCVFRESVTGVFGIVTDDFGNVTGDSGVVTEEVSSQI
ncbi:patatin-like phospholipase family protein [Variovorax sp. J22R24]|uniref:patatin-like phospholipase family protein n=1 Tax=Variovorax gracilis TaxID=3053502 RepID=UPI002577341A|nr:patatin-like phospholipase family protein [Variovorax sp. J22R24]MDM0110457.1 patatin-like phospholipase family protein [Variovorax sp. J22R24]